MTALRRPLVLLCLLLLAGCASRGPDLKRLYASTAAAQRPQPPVILIHGAFGSTLEHDGEEIWPGSWSQFVIGDGFPELALPIDAQRLMPREDGSRAVALFDKLAGVDFYARIRQTLSSAGGYRETTAGVPVTDPTARHQYVFVYDWRQDIPATAARLEEFIAQIRADHGDPDLRVDLVAHSMGGMLVRYFALFGGTDVLDEDSPVPTHAGADSIRKAVLIGTPNLGSMSAVQGMMHGHRIGLARIFTEVAVTTPGAYQLLPHPDRDWMITEAGLPVRRDFYDADTWEHFGWGPFDPAVRARVRAGFDDPADAEARLDLLARFFRFQLARARSFHRAISQPSEVPYILFGGDCELTPARGLIERVDGSWQVRFKPTQIVNRDAAIDYGRLMLEPGDGTVTKPSLLGRNALDPSAPVDPGNALAIAWSVFLCERHYFLTGNVHFRDNLLNTLLLQETTEDRLRAVGDGR